MKLRKLSAATAILATGALVLSGCTPGGDNGDAADTSNGENGDNGDNGATEAESGQQYSAEASDGSLAEMPEDFETMDDEIDFSMGDVEFLSYNGNQNDTYNTTNSSVVNLLQSGFWYYGTDLSINQNEEFGSYEVTSEDPFTVEYTINDEVEWSDGTPVTVADYVLAWGYSHPGIVDPEEPEDADGNPNYLFNSISKSFGEYVPEGPQGDLDGKTFTVEYPEAYADWELLVTGLQPAHVVAEEAGMSVEELSEAFRAQDSEALVEAADFWNDGGWFTDAGTLPDEELVPSSGPYMLDSWVAGEYVSLVANPDYWGTPAGTERINFHFASDDTHTQALENGDLDVIRPQATVDTLEQLEGLGDSVVIHETEVATWEHLDFNFSDQSVFSDPEMREAFALCVPRQTIVDNLIAPLNPDAEVLNGREVFNYQDNYDSITSESYDGSYDEVDIEAAAQILEDNDAVDTEVRIGYQSPNPRRSDIVSLIAASCAEAGFDVVDAGDEDFFGSVLSTGDWDLALFAWAGSGQAASGRNIYHSDGGQNDSGYSNEELDGLWDELVVTTDADEREPLTAEIEGILWDDLFNLPLFVHPGVSANDSTIFNVRDTAAQTGISWNADQWQRAEQSAE